VADFRAVRCFKSPAALPLAEFYRVDGLDSVETSRVLGDLRIPPD
jgi:hypothetical protein